MSHTQAQLYKGYFMNKRNKGALGEEIACRYLINKGCTIVDRNFRGSKGEIDIIFKDGDFLVFAEVKARTTLYVDYGWQAVTKTKQMRIINTAMEYIVKKGLSFNDPMRFDVIDIFEKEISHYKNAFKVGD